MHNAIARAEDRAPPRCWTIAVERPDGSWSDTYARELPEAEQHLRTRLATEQLDGTRLAVQITRSDGQRITACSATRTAGVWQW
jgi:hypothetical protein